MAILIPGMKSQTVRLIDVFFLGPFMAYSSKYLPSGAKEAMFVAGVATILYNGRNYLRYEKRS